MNVAVIGTGYVGLVVGACLAETGNDVMCADIDERKIAGLREGRLPIYEPGLETLVTRNQREGRLQFTTDVGAAVERSDIVFIAVGTPPDEDGSADLQHVLAVARTIGRHMNRPKVVVTKSTVPVGTAARLRAEIAKHTTLSFHVCSNPVFLKEGAAVEDFMKPDRVIVGADADGAARLLGELYAPLVRTGNPIVYMDVPSAEMTKYAANAMLATRISFMNQIARLCEALGADVTLVRKGIGADRRIGPAFLFPGPGYGGSCFPKDVKALIRTAEEQGVSLDILHAVKDVERHALFLGGADEGLHVLGEAGTSVAGAGEQERRADAPVGADSLPHERHVGAERLAQPGDLVHERDARGEHGVRRILRHLGRRHVHVDDGVAGAHQRRVQLPEEASGSIRVRTHDHAIRLHEVLDRRAFLQEHRVGADVKRQGGVLGDLGPQPRGRPDW